MSDKQNDGWAEAEAEHLGHLDQIAEMARADGLIGDEPEIPALNADGSYAEGEEDVAGIDQGGGRDI